MFCTNFFDIIINRQGARAVLESKEYVKRYTWMKAVTQAPGNCAIARSC